MRKVIVGRLADSGSRDSKYIIKYTLRKCVEASRFDILTDLTNPNTFDDNISSGSARLVRGYAKDLLRKSI